MKKLSQGKKTRPGGKPRYKPFRRPERESFQVRDKDEDEVETPEAPARLESVLEAFEKIWTNMFSEPVHLDSALSKQTKRLKSTLARILPVIFMRPSSQAEILGVGVHPGEPWNLTPAQLCAWRPARLMAERIYAGMESRPMASKATAEDFPPHMVREWKESFGAEVAAELVEILGQEAPLSLRAARKTGSAALLKALGSDGKLPVRAEISDLSPLGVRLGGYAPVLGTPSYERGDFEIQDEGSQVMALFAIWPERFAGLLQEKPGRVTAKTKPGEGWLSPLPAKSPAWTVVDACCGAGGKSLALADALQGGGRIFSYDTSIKKLQALRRRATHAGYNNIQTCQVEDGQEGLKIGKFRRRAQLVLVDAPCSGWGVLRRNPDIKWRQNRDVLERMPEIQGRLLQFYSDQVAPGGRLVYGVCTFREIETRIQVERFLAANPDFTRGPGGFLGPGPCDGFFMQAFERKGSGG